MKKKDNEYNIELRYRVKEQDMKKLILAAIILIGSLFVLMTYRNADYKEITIPSGTIVVPKEWNVIGKPDGMILCNNLLCPSEGIIYMFQFEYEKRQDDWFVVNDEVGTYMVLGVDHDGKNGIYSNNTQITTLNIEINNEVHRYYQLDIWTVNQDKVMFLIDAEYVKWSVVEKTALSYVENN